MQRAMLSDKDTAVDTDNLMIRESYLYHTASKIIICRLTVDRHEDMGRCDEVIGISGRQTLTILIINRIRERQFHQIVGFAFLIAEKRQLCAHLEKIFKMFVVYISTAGK